MSCAGSRRIFQPCAIIEVPRLKPPRQRTRGPSPMVTSSICTTGVTNDVALLTNASRADFASAAVKAASS